MTEEKTLTEGIEEALHKAVTCVKDSCLLTLPEALDIYQDARFLARWAGIDTKSYEAEVGEYLRV